MLREMLEQIMDDEDELREINLSSRPRREERRKQRERERMERQLTRYDRTGCRFSRCFVSFILLHSSHVQLSPEDYQAGVRWK